MPNTLRNTRNSSRGRGIRRGSSFASPHAHQQSPRRPGCFSPSQPNKLPPATVRSQQHKQSSQTSRSATTPVSTSTMIINSSKDDDNGGIHNINEVNQDQDLPNPGSNLQVGDNTSFEVSSTINKTKPDPTLGKQDRLTPSQDLESYWQKAFDELKGMARPVKN